MMRNLFVCKCGYSVRRFRRMHRHISINKGHVSRCASSGHPQFTVGETYETKEN